MIGISKHKFLYIIPFIVLFADLYASLFETKSNMRAYIFGLELLILLIMLIPKLYFKFKAINNLGRIILLFLLYTLILVPLSSDIKLTLTYYLRLFVTFLVLINAYYYLDSPNKLFGLIKLFPFLLILNYVYFLYCTYFNIGSSAYKGQFLSVGFQSYSSQFVFAIAFISFLLFAKYFDKKKKLIFNIVNVVTIIFLLMIFRRTNFLIILIGIFLMTILSNKTRKDIAKVVVLSIALGLFFINDIARIVEDNLSVRQRITTVDNYTKEGRYIENMLVINSIKNSTIKTLFGTGELFNSRGKYGLNTGDKWASIRPLHNDYSRLLFGTGSIGLLIYIIIVIKMFFYVKKKKSNFSELKIFGYFLITCLFLVGLSSGITDLYYRIILFLLIGSSLRILDEEVKYNMK